MGYFPTRASPARGVAKFAGIGAVYRAKSEKAVCGLMRIKIASPSGRAGDAQAGLRPLFPRDLGQRVWSIDLLRFLSNDISSRSPRGALIG